MTIKIVTWERDKLLNKLLDLSLRSIPVLSFLFLQFLLDC